MAGTPLPLLLISSIR